MYVLCVWGVYRGVRSVWTNVRVNIVRIAHTPKHRLKYWKIVQLLINLFLTLLRCRQNRNLSHALSFSLSLSFSQYIYPPLSLSHSSNINNTAHSLKLVPADKENLSLGNCVFFTTHQTRARPPKSVEIHFLAARIKKMITLPNQTIIRVVDIIILGIDLLLGAIAL